MDITRYHLQRTLFTHPHSKHMKVYTSSKSSSLVHPLHQTCFTTRSRQPCKESQVVSPSMTTYLSGAPRQKSMKLAWKPAYSAWKTATWQLATASATAVSWFGWIFSADEMSADPRKIQSIIEAGRPQSAEDVKSFLQAGVSVQCQVHAWLRQTRWNQYISPTTGLYENATGKWCLTNLTFVHVSMC